jgi:hypothetical protein
LWLPSGATRGRYRCCKPAKVPSLPLATSRPLKNRF